VPFGFGIAELDDGIRVLGRITGDGDPASRRFGERVRLVADPLGVWAFSPEAAS
jgi:uncharacterized OB-fold protein